MIPTGGPHHHRTWTIDVFPFPTDLGKKMTYGDSDFAVMSVRLVPQVEFLSLNETTGHHENLRRVPTYRDNHTSAFESSSE